MPDGQDRAGAIITAMESIEEDYASLRGVLPKSEYQELNNDVLGQLLRTLNPDELKRVSGDVFGRIYEYFLTQFADQMKRGWPVSSRRPRRPAQAAARTRYAGGWWKPAARTS